MDKHDTLLIASWSQENRRQLRTVLEKRYNLLEAKNIQQLCLLLEQNMDCVAAAVLDVTVPEKLDLQVLCREETVRLLQAVPVIISCGSEENPQLLNMAFEYGAADVIPLDYEPYAMLRRIENIVDLHVHKQHLQTMVEEHMNMLRHSNETMVDALSSIIEYRSVESGQHILRIRRFTKILLEELARTCPEYQLTDRQIAIISNASALHDIGKIAIPDAILLKPGRLTEEEREIMKTHSLTGCEILDSLHDMGDPEYLRYSHNICHYHHERWDGGGYPEGLSGDDIPICAQVVGLADVYDALTTKRVYKDAYSFTTAVNMILRGDCGAFSPKLLECFKHVTGQYEALARAYADGTAPDKEEQDMTLPRPVETAEGDSLGRVRAKYYALVHYINGLVVEADLNRGLFHLIYNPYPELDWIQNVTSLEQINMALNERAIAPESRDKMLEFLQTELREFMDANMRRLTRHFRFRSQQRPEGEEFEVTLLRINPIDNAEQTLTILCRRTDGAAAVEPEPLRQMGGSTLRCLMDESYTLIRLGSHIPLLAGYTQEELKTLFHNQMIWLVLPEDREKMRGEIRDSLTRGTTGMTEYRVRSKDGEVIWVRNTFFLRTSVRGEAYMDCYLADITSSKDEFDNLNDKLRRYEIILAQTENVLFEWDYIKDSISCSDTWKTIFGLHLPTGKFRAALVDGMYFHPDDLPMLIDKIVALENGSPYEMVEARLLTAYGRYIWCRIRATAIRNVAGKLERIAGIIINIDSEMKAQRQLQDRADRDSLTNLLNKNAARKHAEEYLRRISGDLSCALLIIDLDDFKEVNDRYGHLFGDAVLTRIAREIEKSFRVQDIVARIGGDEFMVLMRGVSDRSLPETRCKRLLEVIRNVVQDKWHRLPVSCSIGIAMAPEDGTTYYELFSKADQALYYAKSQGKNCYASYAETGAVYSNTRRRSSKPIDSDMEPGMAEENIVRHTFEKLYRSKNIEHSVHEILEMIGRKTNVSRVYVFENSEDNRFCTNTYEWCNDGIQSEIRNLQNISYETDIPGYADYFDENGIFYCPDISMVSKGAYEILEPQGIKSMLQCAIRENGVFRGYIGFDECVEQRIWTKQEIQLLSFLSEMLSVFLLNLQHGKKTQHQADTLQSILDNQAAWTYVVRAGSFRLEYLNSSLRKQLPKAEAGGRCYEVLKNRESPCSYCPLADPERNTAGGRLLQEGEAQLLLEAAEISWNGEKACMMTCRKLP